MTPNLLSLRTTLGALVVFTMAPFAACGGDTTESAGTPGGTGGTSVAGSAGSGGSGGTSGSGGLPSEWFRCVDTSDCLVREAQCCQACGVTSVSGGIAVSRSFLEALSGKLCEAQTEPCPIADCAFTPPYVLPFCLEGRCTAIDIREDLLTSCGTDAQCRLRWSTGCCETCSDSPEYLVAVNSQVDYTASVCGSQPGACPPCVPPAYPDTARAVCADNFHCEVVWQ